MKVGATESPDEAPVATRCFDCFRPSSLCFCDTIPSIRNRTPLLILQHRRERFHRFNTARIVHRALDRCQLMVGHNKELAERMESTPLNDGVGLLYPGNESRLLADLPGDERPKQLVVLDGTWHHVKTLMRDVPRLHTLPQYRLAPAQPGRYRIRREPNDQSLSTLEATVAALKSMEPETIGIDRLTLVFDKMINDQLRQGSSNWRQNRRRRSGAPNVPRVLLDHHSSIVVAYGERERGNQERAFGAIEPLAKPISWNAIRLGSGETFQSVIESNCLNDSSFLDLLGLSHRDVSSPESERAFGKRWRDFLRPNDHVAIHHPSTARLLKNVDADYCPTVILKSIHFKKDTSISETQVAERLALIFGNSRASARLAKSVALVETLRRVDGANRVDSFGQLERSAR